MAYALDSHPVTDESTYYGNFEAEFRNFWTNSSYYCMFAGLGFLSDRPLPLLSHLPGSLTSAELTFADVRSRRHELIDTLPSTYSYLRQLHRT